MKQMDYGGNIHVNIVCMNKADYGVNTHVNSLCMNKTDELRGNLHGM